MEFQSPSERTAGFCRAFQLAYVLAEGKFRPDGSQGGYGTAEGRLMKKVCRKFAERKSYQRSANESDDCVRPGTVETSAVAKQDLHSPMSAVGESEEEGDAYQSSVDRALAPALEHSHQSNDEEQDGKSGCALDPHNPTSCLRLARDEQLLKGRESHGPVMGIGDACEVRADSFVRRSPSRSRPRL